MDDLQLRRSILDELDYEPTVDAANIGVAVKGGIVTLTGHVPSYAEKVAAERAVRRVRGVRAIAEEIEIRVPNEKRTSDDEIAKRAADILQWDTTVPKDAIEITVQHGWVTLNGTVDWNFQRSAAETDIHRLSGVAGVHNQIKIEPRLRISDLQRRIEGALKRNAEIEAKDIQITEQGGTVTLTGTVRDWAEYEAIRRVVWSAPGVQSVDDQLTFGP
jgi:osmotically-inducible protein OsmY